MARKEPYVNVDEVIKDEPVRLSIDGSSNVGVVIVAPVGPKLAVVQGPDDFLKKYTIDGVTVPRDADISFINAYYMSFFSGLVVARSMNTDSTGGLQVRWIRESNQLKLVPTYFKDEVELTKKYSGLISIPEVSKIELTSVNGGWAKDEESFNSMVPESYRNVEGQDYESSKESLPWLVVNVSKSGSGKVPVKVVFPESVTLDEGSISKIGTYIDERSFKLEVNEYFMLEATELGLDSAEDLDITVYGLTTLESESVDTEFSLSIKSQSQSLTNGAQTKISNSNWGFVIDSTLYYVGDYDKVVNAIKASDGVNVSSLTSVRCDELMEDDGSYDAIAALVASLNGGDTYVATEGVDSISLYMDKYTSVTFNEVETIDSDGNSVTKKIQPVNISVGEFSESSLPEDTQGELVMTIACSTPQVSTVNPYNIKFQNQRILKGRRVFDLVLNGETYVMSFDKDAVDSSDLSCFIEQMNTIDGIEFTFTMVMNDASEVTFEDTEADFGHSFLDLEMSTEVAYKSDALNSLDDQELYQIAYLAPCGETRVSWIKAYTSLGIRRKWFTPVDVPYDRTNSNSIKQYGDNVDDDYNIYMCGPFDKNTGLTGWLNYIAGSTLYYERVMSNKANNSEFAPVFGDETGVLQYTNPVKLLKKSQREELISLGKPINYVIYDEPTGTYYMNDNWTHYTLCENVMGEESNVRMLHKISRDLDRLYRQFKAKHNTEQTRNNVNTVTDLYFKQNIMTQNYKPQEYLITCDLSNNTDAIIRARKLAIRVQVRLYNSIKYIDVINQAYSVGGAAFEE